MAPATFAFAAAASLLVLSVAFAADVAAAPASAPSPTPSSTPFLRSPPPSPSPPRPSPPSPPPPSPPPPSPPSPPPPSPPSPPPPSPPPSPPQLCDYSVLVRTSRKYFAGTSAEVMVQFFDAQGRSLLDDTYVGSNFNSGQIVVSHKWGRCVGGATMADACRMLVTRGYSNWRDPKGWHADWVRLRSYSAKLDRTFHINAWLTNDKPVVEVNRC